MNNFIRVIGQQLAFEENYPQVDTTEIAKFWVHPSLHPKHGLAGSKLIKKKKR